MADTGFNWGAWTAMQKSASDWTSDALGSGSEEQGDEVSLDGIAACEVSIALVEDNTGAISGDVTVYVLGAIDGTNFEEYDKGSPLAFAVTPVQNDTVYKRFFVDPGMFGSFVLALYNTSGQEVAATVKYRTATIPAAS